MWDETRQRRLDELRRQALLRALSSDEDQELARLMHEVERDEWAALGPALGRLADDERQGEAELTRARARNAALASLAEKYADLVERARLQLAALRHEREVLRAEYERALR